MPFWLGPILVLRLRHGSHRLRQALTLDSSGIPNECATCAQHKEVDMHVIATNCNLEARREQGAGTKNVLQGTALHCFARYHKVEAAV